MSKVKEWLIPLYPTILQEMVRIADVPVSQLTCPGAPIGVKSSHSRNCDSAVRQVGTMNAVSSCSELQCG
jgi:hypothetical protein